MRLRPSVSSQHALDNEGKRRWPAAKTVRHIGKLFLPVVRGIKQRRAAFAWNTRRGQNAERTKGCVPGVCVARSFLEQDIILSTLHQHRSPGVCSTCYASVRAAYPLDSRSNEPPTLSPTARLEGHTIVVKASSWRGCMKFYWYRNENEWRGGGIIEIGKQERGKVIVKMIRLISQVCKWFGKGGGCEGGVEWSISSVKSLSGWNRRYPLLNCNLQGRTEV